MPQFGILPGEDPKKIRAANERLKSVRRDEMLDRLEKEAVLEEDLSPEKLGQKSDEAVKRIDGDLREIEGMGPGHPDRSGSVEKVRKEIEAHIEYLEKAGARLKLSDGSFSKNLNKLRAFRDYLADL